MSKKVIIIGAGVGGMATANLLAKIGYKVEVYEQHPGPGGRAGKFSADGFTFDTGPSWYLMPEVFEQYFGLLGAKPEDYYTLARLKPAYKVFYDYRSPLTVSGDLDQDKKMFEAVEVGAGARLAHYVASAEEVYRTSIQKYLYNPTSFIRAATDMRIIRDLPMLSKFLLQPLHAKVARTVSSLPLQQILEYPTVFLGVSPFNAPSLYHLMSYIDFKQGVYYPMGGMYTFVEALAALGQQLGVTYHYDSAVSKIVTANGRATGVMVDGSLHQADIVISAADLHFTETQLLDSADRTYPESYWRNKTAAPSGLLIYLGVRGSLQQLNHHNLLFVENWRNNFDAIFSDKHWPKQASMYVSRTSATDPTTAPTGHENLFVFVPLPAGINEPDDIEAAANHYIQQFAQASGITDLADRIVYRSVRSAPYFMRDFNAWQGSALGMAHTLRQSAFWRPGPQSKKVSNLLYTGAGVQPGIGLPMCLISAELVVKQLTGDRTIGPIKSLETMHV
jgi:phytoene desaturase